MSRGILRSCVARSCRLPGIGERTATFGVLVVAAVAKVAEQIGEERYVSFRLKLVDAWSVLIFHVRPMPSMLDSEREQDIICVVERPQDIQAVEGSGSFKGAYHVLDGAISPLDGVGPEQLRIRELIARLEDGSVQEVLIATDPDVEGDATALYLARILKPAGVRVTRLAHGISVGTELEYADRSSVARALENRRDIK